jgi:hypothetical protein
MVELGPVGSPAAAGHHSGHAGRVGRHHAGPAFHQVLTAAMRHGHVNRPASTITNDVKAAVAGVQNAALHLPLSLPHPALPPASDAALVQAMDREGVPQSWRPALQFIMAHESGGQVGARNPVHSARGLFQLTAAHYHLNPNGARSFGNAVEEAQGGIRYIQQRYGTADNAVAFWRQHRWY